MKLFKIPNGPTSRRNFTFLANLATEKSVIFQREIFVPIWIRLCCFPLDYVHVKSDINFE